MNVKTLIKLFAAIGAVVAAGVSAYSDFTEEKRMDEKIEEAVNAKLAEREETEA